MTAPNFLLNCVPVIGNIIGFLAAFALSKMGG
jgi:hypothetical protein